ncbi:hypothetical protein [Sutterella wadsworthensis]|uniref:hypothetical protein n=1 Tax=Sutterella wadsworthensis TaxID=40545 RepID=UPI003080D6CC
MVLPIPEKTRGQGQTQPGKEISDFPRDLFCFPSVAVCQFIDLQKAAASGRMKAVVTEVLGKRFVTLSLRRHAIRIIQAQ